MKQIFITTRISSLQDLFRDTDYENSAKSLNIPFTLAEGEFSIHIVSDEIEFTRDYKIDKDKDGILFHDSSSTDVKVTISNSFNRSKGGSHISGSLHEKVFKTLFDNEKDKVKRVIELVFPTAEAILSKKLDLLHNLLVPPADFAEVNKQWEEIETTVESAKASGINVSLATNEDALKAFQMAVNGINDPFDPGYIKALADLRDAILPS